MSRRDGHCSEKEKQAYRIYHATHKEQESEYHKKYRLLHGNEERAKSRAREIKIRERVFEHYGERCSWPGCNVSDMDMLQLDHIGGGGNKHRREVGKGQQFYRYLIKNGFPAGLRVLCANHNFKHHAILRRRRLNEKNE